MSSRTDGEERRTAFDHAQREQSRRDYYDRQQFIKDKIDKCSKALSRGKRRHYAYVAAVLRDELLPALDEHTSSAFSSYGDRLRNSDQWDWVAFSTFLNDPDEYVDRLSDSPSVTGISLAQRSTGLTDEDTNARMTVRKTLQSVVAIAESEEIVMPDYASKVDAVGFSKKIGVHLQDAEMDIGDPVKIISERSGALKTLFSGGTGQGKSAALETEAEDYYRRNFEEGRDFKLIDLVGLRDGENWFYDIPQHDDDLRDVRSEMGLAESFADADDADPQMEILAPLAPGLPDELLPFDTEGDQFVVKPFTVPASDIRKPLLVSILAAKLTPQQETIIRSAYDEVDRSKTDWALLDLAEEIKSRDELGPDKKQPVISTLRQLQNQGFIRTHEDENTLDWRDVFEDSETITVFTQAFLDSTIAQLIAFGYLANTIVKKREAMHGIPQCVLLMRELWKVAPHNRRQAFDGRAASLQEAIGKMLSQLFRENRHSGVHVLADTQQPSDLLKPVREMFNRYVVFAVDQDTAKKIFDWTANNKWRSFYSTLTAKPGEASVVGMTEPAIEERHIEFVGPVRYAPPSHHHRMEKVDTTGWRARAKYKDSEELRRPAAVNGTQWDDSVPTRLIIGENKSDDDDGVPDPEIDPVGAFAHRCLAVSPDDRIKKQDVYDAFNAFLMDEGRDPREFDQSAKTKFGRRIASAFDEMELKSTKIDGDVAWRKLTLNERGEAYLTEAYDGHEDAAAPIRGD